MNKGCFVLTDPNRLLVVLGLAGLSWAPCSIQQNPITWQVGCMLISTRFNSKNQGSFVVTDPNRYLVVLGLAGLSWALCSIQWNPTTPQVARVLLPTRSKGKTNSPEVHNPLCVVVFFDDAMAGTVFAFSGNTWALCTQHGGKGICLPKRLSILKALSKFGTIPPF